MNVLVRVRDLTGTWRVHAFDAEEAGRAIAWYCGVIRAGAVGIERQEALDAINELERALDPEAPYGDAFKPRQRFGAW